MSILVIGRALCKYYRKKNNFVILVRHIGQALLGKGDHSLFLMDLVSIMVTLHGG